VFDDDFTYQIDVVNESTGRVIREAADAFDPAVSPDSRWLVFRSYRPRILDKTFSEQYMLYDLGKGVGARVMYPSVPGHARFKNIGVPTQQEHEFRADEYFWASDSRSLVFADSLGSRLSLVWVKIGPDGEFETYIHPVSGSALCHEATSKVPLTTLSHAQVGMASDGTPELRADLTVDPVGTCAPATLVLRNANFKRAELEHFEPLSRPSADR
jgi:WD40-like Beta Propeller Repeat